MGRADEGVAAVDWATLTGRDGPWECGVQVKYCGDAGMAACLVVLVSSWCPGEICRDKQQIYV